MTPLMSEQIDQLAISLRKVQTVLENITRNKQGHKHKYAELSDCFDFTRKLLTDNGLSVTQLGLCYYESGRQLLTTVLLHDSGQWLRSEFFLDPSPSKLCNDLQNLGIAITYIRRYAFCATIGLAQEDDDGEGYINPPNGAKEPIDFPHETLNNIRQLIETGRVLDAFTICESIKDKKHKLAIWSSLDVEQRNKLTEVKRTVSNG